MKCELCGLSTETSKPFHNTTDECIFAHNARYQDLVDAVAQMRRDVTEAAIKLFQYVPESALGIINEEFWNGDKNTPFFTETYLYTLMGKEDGRTVLALVRHLIEAAGFDGYDIHTFEEKAARTNANGERLC